MRHTYTHRLLNKEFNILQRLIIHDSVDLKGGTERDLSHPNHRQLVY